jgi:hypothetical protein
LNEKHSKKKKRKKKLGGTNLCQTTVHKCIRCIFLDRCGVFSFVPAGKVKERFSAGFFLFSFKSCSQFVKDPFLGCVHGHRHLNFYQ